MRATVAFLSSAMVILTLAVPAAADSPQALRATSADGVEIAYESVGKGEPTLGFLHGLRLYGGDAGLKRKVGQFLDVVWADWAQTQIGGVHGGPKTRHQGTVLGGQPMTTFARFFLGGGGTTDFLYGLQLCDDYQWPSVVWHLSSNRPFRQTNRVPSIGPKPTSTSRLMPSARICRR